MIEDIGLLPLFIRFDPGARTNMMPTAHLGAHIAADAGLQHPKDLEKADKQAGADALIADAGEDFLQPEILSNEPELKADIGPLEF